MTTVPATSFYEWPSNNDTAYCESCGKEMQVPDTEDPNRSFKEPFWWKEEVKTYIGGNYDKFHSYCESCYAEKINDLREEVSDE